MEAAIIAARAVNGVIGLGGAIPWSIPDDIKHFKLLTTGEGNNAVIMGKRTWQSIGRPLPNRDVIVLAHDAVALREYTKNRVHFAESLPLALNMAREMEAHIAWIAGGEAVYAQALPLCSKLYITEVLIEAAGDTYFPQFDKSQYKIEESPVQRGGTYNGAQVEYKFVTYTRYYDIM